MSSETTTAPSTPPTVAAAEVEVGEPGVGRGVEMGGPGVVVRGAIVLEEEEVVCALVVTLISTVLLTLVQSLG